jgi:hypothetical protein
VQLPPSLLKPRKGLTIRQKTINKETKFEPKIISLKVTDHTKLINDYPKFDCH